MLTSYGRRLERALLLARGAAAAAAAASSGLCGGIEAALHGLSAGFFLGLSGQNSLEHKLHVTAGVHACRRTVDKRQNSTPA